MNVFFSSEVDDSNIFQTGFSMLTLSAFPVPTSKLLGYSEAIL